MSATRDIEAASAYVRLYLKQNELAKGLKSAGDMVDKWAAKVRAVGVTVSAMGAALGAPLVASVKTFADMGSELADVSARTGMAVLELSELKHAAEMSGASIEDLEKSLRKSGITTSKQFEGFAESILAMRNPARQIEAVIKKMGKSGAMLIPLLRTGRAGVRALTDEADRLGLSFRSEAVARAEELGDKLETVVSVFKKSMFEVGAALEPVITPLVDVVTKALVGLSEWIQKNPEAVQKFAKAVVAIVAAGGGLIAVSLALKVIAGGLLSLAFVVGGLATVFAALPAIAPWLLGAAAAAQANLTPLEMLKAAWEKLSATVGTTVKAISNSIMAGDMENAFKIIALTAETIWLTLLSKMKNAWAGFVGWLETAINKVVQSTVGIVNSVLSQLPPFLTGGQSKQISVAPVDLGAKAADTKAIDDRLTKATAELGQAITKGIYTSSEIKELANRPRKDDFEDFEAGEFTKKASGIFNPFAVRSIGRDVNTEYLRQIAESSKQTAKKIKVVTFR